MKNENLIKAAIPSVIAAAVIVLSVSLPISVDRLVEYGAVLALLAIAALEYRIDWKRLFGR
jgi:hypothetical protein